MNELDRWVDLEGPPPAGVRELLGAACSAPPLTPELEERLDRRLAEALAVERARWARRRRAKRWLGAGLLAACLTSGIGLALGGGPHLGAPDGLAVTVRIVSSAAERAQSRMGDVETVAPSAEPATPQGSPPAPRAPRAPRPHP